MMGGFVVVLVVVKEFWRNEMKGNNAWLWICGVGWREGLNQDIFLLAIRIYERVYCT
jgi:hypothetical protein